MTSPPTADASVDPPCFRLDNPLAGGGPLARVAGRAAVAALEQLMGFPSLNSLHAAAVRHMARRGGSAAAPGYSAAALHTIRARYVVTDEALARVPPRGPLLVVSNHPFGGLDGLVLDDLITRVRADLKILANDVLGRIPQLRPGLLLVDSWSAAGSAAAARNSGALREAARWVREGRAVGLFPAGWVSRYDPRVGRVTDPPWNPVAARLARAADAAVLPVFFAGQNSALFQAAGFVNVWLRTVLLPRELLRRVGTRVDVRIGRPISAAELRTLTSDAATDTLRRRVYELGRQGSESSLRLA